MYDGACGCESAVLEAVSEADQRVSQPATGVLITLEELHYVHREEVTLFATAQRKIGQLVHKPALAALSDAAFDGLNALNR